MAITIHCQMPPGLFPIEEIPPSEVCQPMIDRAEGIARRVPDHLRIPHRLQRPDQRIPAPGRDDHYGLVYEMLGPAEGCEPLTYGWSYQSDHETRRSLPDGSWQWVMTWGPRCFVKADYARDPILTHIAVATIIHIWHHQGLIGEYIDEANYLPEELSFPNLTEAERTRQGAVVLFAAPGSLRIVYLAVN